MAVMLIVSGIAKLRRPDDLTGWAEMGVPKALRKQWLLVLHPWGEMALGVLSAFHQHQVAVPGEKSVIGYDDTYESSFFYPALSTVSLDLDLQGKEAVRRILASTSGAPHTSSILPARLVIRHSSGARIEQGKDLQAIAEQLRAIAHRLAP